jgi:hypothetical protein
MPSLPVGDPRKERVLEAAFRHRKDLARAEVEAERDQLLSAIKQHKNATESRLRLLDSRGEAERCMLKPDRDLYEFALNLPRGAKTSA